MVKDGIRAEGSPWPPTASTKCPTSRKATESSLQSWNGKSCLLILSPSRRMTRITVPRASPRPLTCSHLELEMSHQKPFFMATTAASLPPAISAHVSHFIRRGERERIFQIITLFYERTSEGERKQALHSDSLGLRHVLSHTSLPSYKQ